MHVHVIIIHVTCNSTDRYKPGKKTKAEMEHIIADKIDAVDWEALKKDKSYARIEVGVFWRWDYVKIDIHLLPFFPTL